MSCKTDRKTTKKNMIKLKFLISPENLSVILDIAMNDWF